MNSREPRNQFTIGKDNGKRPFKSYHHPSQIQVNTLATRFLRLTSLSELRKNRYSKHTIQKATQQQERRRQTDSSYDDIFGCLLKKNVHTVFKNFRGSTDILSGI